jgi:hypothetical protein
LPPAKENAGIACSAWKKTGRNGPLTNINSNTRWHSKETGEQIAGLYFFFYLQSLIEGAAAATVISPTARSVSALRSICIGTADPKASAFWRN